MRQTVHMKHKITQYNFKNNGKMIRGTKHIIKELKKIIKTLFPKSFPNRDHLK